LGYLGRVVLDRRCVRGFATVGAGRATGAAHSGGTMKSSRILLLTIGLSSVVAFAGACGATSGGASGATSGGPAASSGSSAPAAVAPGDAKDALVTATTKTQGTTSTFTLKSTIGTTGSGKLDPTNKVFSSALDATALGKTVHTESVVSGTDIYLKLSLQLPGVDPNKWIHVDTTKAKSLAAFGLGDPSDPTATKAFAASIVSAQSTGNGTYKGTIDLTKNPAIALSTQMQQAGDAVKAVPFEATIDGQGYLTQIVTHMPALGATVPASTTTVTFADLGKSVTIDVPAKADTQEAPAALYAVIGG
jgi:hypothetical protein